MRVLSNGVQQPLLEGELLPERWVSVRLFQVFVDCNPKLIGFRGTPSGAEVERNVGETNRCDDGGEVEPEGFCAQTNSVGYPSESVFTTFDRRTTNVDEDVSVLFLTGKLV